MRRFLSFYMMLLPMMLVGCGELEELRHIKTIQDARIAELEKQNNEYKDAFFKQKTEREKERLKSAQEIENLKSDLKVYEVSRTQNEKQLAEQNANLRRQNQAIANDLAAVQAELAKKKEEFNSKLADFGNSISTKQNELIQLNDEKTALQSELNNSKKQIALHESNLAAQKTDIENLNAQIAQKDAAIQTHQNKIAALENEQQKTKTAADENINKLNAEIESLKKSIAIKSSDAAETAVSIAAAETEIKTDLALEITSHKIQILSDKRGLAIRIPSDALFEPASVIIGGDAKPLLSKIANILKKYPNIPVDVEGHTDNVPIQNLPFMDNLALSSARADVVVRYLIEAGGIPSQRLKSIACSWYHPAAPNDTPEGQGLNRRVEIILSQK